MSLFFDCQWTVPGTLHFASPTKLQTRIVERMNEVMDCTVPVENVTRPRVDHNRKLELEGSEVGKAHGSLSLERWTWKDQHTYMDHFSTMSSPTGASLS